MVAATLLPIPGNFKLYVVHSGSMEPAVKTGSLIFVKPAKSYAIGDIVTFKEKKNTITHRIVEQDEGIFKTKGDANEEADTQAIFSDQITGKMILALPYLGYPVGYAQTRVGFIFLVLIPAIVIIYDELHRIKREVANIWKKKRERKMTESLGHVRIEEKVKFDGHDQPVVSRVQFGSRFPHSSPSKRKIV